MYIYIIPHPNFQISPDMKVLIIDDDVEDTEMFCDALKDVAPQVSCAIANTPSTGLDYVNGTLESPPLYIFLDANMAQDGKECLRQLRMIEKLKDTKIIMYSGYISDAQMLEFKMMGANEYVRKPNSYQQLLKVLSSVVRPL
jgi:DNA-binding response OmpR family regulator